MKKYDLAKCIESHHLYSPIDEGVYSKNYFRYSSNREIELLMKFKKQELQDMYDMLYGNCGRELSLHEINY